MSQTLTRQLEEIQLIQCSLLPGELFEFIEDSETWSQLLETYTTGTSSDANAEDSIPPPAHFQVILKAEKIWFEVELPHYYPERAAPMPILSVKGENITRHEQERWHGIVKEKMEDVGDTDYPIYQLISLHLLPLVHAERELVVSEDSIHEASKLASAPPLCHYHALFTSHHLISPTKRRSLQQWSSVLSISGFAKVGYPGVIYAQGAQENVEEFVGNVKAMQWLALKVRFMEPVHEAECKGGNIGERKWVEFQKVGEVVEEMKRIGREEYILEMGIGSAGSTK